MFSQEKIRMLFRIKIVKYSIWNKSMWNRHKVLSKLFISLWNKFALIVKVLYNELPFKMIIFLIKNLY